jgi:hypothetical protein
LAEIELPVLVPPQLEAAICDLKSSNSLFLSSNIKSNLKIIRLSQAPGTADKSDWVIEALVRIA